MLGECWVYTVCLVWTRAGRVHSRPFVVPLSRLNVHTLLHATDTPFTLPTLPLQELGRALLTGPKLRDACLSTEQQTALAKLLDEQEAKHQQFLALGSSGSGKSGALTKLKGFVPPAPPVDGSAAAAASGHTASTAVDVAWLPAAAPGTVLGAPESSVSVSSDQDRQRKELLLKQLLRLRQKNAEQEQLNAAPPSSLASADAAATPLHPACTFAQQWLEQGIAAAPPSTPVPGSADTHDSSQVQCVAVERLNSSAVPSPPPAADDNELAGQPCPERELPTSPLTVGIRRGQRVDAHLGMLEHQQSRAWAEAAEEAEARETGGAACPFRSADTAAPAAAVPAAPSAEIRDMADAALDHSSGAVSFAAAAVDGSGARQPAVFPPSQAAEEASCPAGDEWEDLWYTDYESPTTRMEEDCCLEPMEH